MKKKKNNNIQFYLLGIILISIATLFLPWGKFISQGSYAFLNTEYIAKGTNGYITILGAQIYLWVFVLLTVLATSVLLLNIRKMAQIPLIIPIIMDILSLLGLLLAGFIYFNLAGIQLGHVIMIITTIASLVLAIKAKKA